MEVSGHLPSLAALEKRKTSYAFQKWNHDVSSAEVKERVELYLYSPSGLSWPVLG